MGQRLGVWSMPMRRVEQVNSRYPWYRVVRIIISQRSCNQHAGWLEIRSKWRIFKIYGCSRRGCSWIFTVSCQTPSLLSDLNISSVSPRETKVYHVRPTTLISIGHTYPVDCHVGLVRPEQRAYSVWRQQYVTTKLQRSGALQRPLTIFWMYHHTIRPRVDPVVTRPALHLRPVRA